MPLADLSDARGAACAVDFGRLHANSRNHVCQLSLGNARFGTIVSRDFVRSISTNKLGDSMQSLNADHGVVMRVSGHDIVRSLSVISTFVPAEAAPRFLRFFIKKKTNKRNTA